MTVLPSKLCLPVLPMNDFFSLVYGMCLLNCIIDPNGRSLNIWCFDARSPGWSSQGGYLTSPFGTLSMKLAPSFAPFSFLVGNGGVEGSESLVLEGLSS